MFRAPCILLTVWLAAPLAAGAEKTTDLPVTRVVLFSCGVAYFEHAGKVTDDAVVRLTFKADQINDVLKSMHVTAEAGTVAGVSYASSDPLLAALKSFAVDLSGNPKLADLLGQLRGAAVTVQVEKRIQGKILGVETRRREVLVGGMTTFLTETMLNLVTAEGIRSVPMNSVRLLTLTDPKLSDELNRAMALLMAAHDTLRKPVDVRFAGKGVRGVRIGYLVAAPVWKTTYRLDLSGKRPKIQGWAIVENTSDFDWSNVELKLVSGKPISFVTDLYKPLHLRRPIVEPKTRVTQEAHRVHEAETKAEEKAREGYVPVEGREEASTLAGRLYARKSRRTGESLFDGDAGGIFADEAVEAVARGRKVGELFHFTVKTPVSLSRRQSAMLPIIHRPIAGEKVSVYSADVLEEHPLNGAYLTNDTGMKMLGGPVTVFDDGAFAGEAMLDILAEKDRALLSYAVDLNVTVSEEEAHGEEVLAAAIADGRLILKFVHGQTWTYQIASTADEPRRVLIRTPRMPLERLVAPKTATEQTDDEFRFQVDVAANSTKKFVVQSEMFTWGWAALDPNEDLAGWGRHMRSTKVAPKLREAIEKFLKSAGEIRGLRAEIKKTEAAIKAIESGQGRLRDNIKTLGAGHRLSKRYVEKLSKQEDQIEALEKKLAGTKGKLKQAVSALREYVQSLKLGEKSVVEEFRGIEDRTRRSRRGSRGGIF